MSSGGQRPKAFPLVLVAAQAPVQPSHGQWELPTSTLFDGASCSNDSSTLNASVSPTSTSISAKLVVTKPFNMFARNMATTKLSRSARSEEHTSELQSLMRTSYAVYGLKKKTRQSSQIPHTLIRLLFHM